MFVSICVSLRLLLSSCVDVLEVKQAQVLIVMFSVARNSVRKACYSLLLVAQMSLSVPKIHAYGRNRPNVRYIVI